MSKPSIVEQGERDEELFHAVQQFFTNLGDVHEFKHVVQDAIAKLPIRSLPLATSVRHKLIDHGVRTVGDLRAMKELDLVALPGVGLQTVRHIQEAVSQFEHMFKEDRRATTIRPANSVQNNGSSTCSV